MSVKSQENNMRRLAILLNRDLGCIFGERECGPNGDKRTFLNVGKTFLRALGKDLGLHDVRVSANPGGIAVSGDCTLIGMWENGGLYINLSQLTFPPRCVGYYRTVRHIRDFKGGYNHLLTHRDLMKLSYPAFLDMMNTLRKDRYDDEQAA